PSATVDLVVSGSTNTTDGIDLSETYIIENNLADIMTESFSACELYSTDGQLAFSSTMAEQAAAQGITYFVSTGDNGTAGCDDPSVAPATYPISVNLIASTAFNVAVGGTEFNENGNPTKYWGTEPPVQESAISYIPENVWNESSLTNGLWSGSGGASAGNYSVGGSTFGVPKPYWQSGVAGIPGDGVRDLPDVSLTAAEHDPYLLCLEGSCQQDSSGQFYVYFISGTSASAPSFAGIMALVDQQQQINTGNARQGLANYVLYRLAAAQSTYPAQCNGSSTSTPPTSTCIFNDVTMGNNAVPGEATTIYSATAGYDLATGLGSVNVANLVNQWSTVTFNPTTTTLALSPTTSIVHGSTVNVNVAVAPNSGTGTPTGDVALIAATGLSASLQTMAGTYPLALGAVASSTSALPGGGPYTVTARYAGDATYAPSISAPVSVTVTAEASTINESIVAYDQTGNSIPLNSVPFGSFIYLRADVRGASGQGFPTGNVTFTDSSGAIPGGSTFNLNSQGNTANPNGVNFDTGTHTLSASYSGDASFNPISTTQSLSVTVTPGFYATIASSASQVVISAPGSTGTAALSIATSTGFTGTITMACVGLPSEATCTFSPASVKAPGTYGTTNVSVMVSTTAATAMAAPQRRTFLLAESMMGMGLLFSVVLVGGRRRRAQTVLLVMMLLLIVTVPGCGGGGGGSHTPPPNSGTPPGVTNIAVTATSGSTVSQTGFTLSVQ
ncbi:MAG TPA: Ig-like domain repeat protein, partial [Candidatus Sulfotelmatobacter sp.]|nr:Ig-like domain repeat protein [Candidatus Sulfotelmatobacter sp.]